jgi:hypothetical protein
MKRGMDCVQKVMHCSTFGGQEKDEQFDRTADFLEAAHLFHQARGECILLLGVRKLCLHSAIRLVQLSCLELG